MELLYLSQGFTCWWLCWELGERCKWKQREEKHLTFLVWSEEGVIQHAAAEHSCDYHFYSRWRATPRLKTNSIKKHTVISSSRMYCRISSYVLFAESIIKKMSLISVDVEVFIRFSKSEKGPGNPISFYNKWFDKVVHWKQSKVGSLQLPWIYDMFDIVIQKLSELDCSNQWDTPEQLTVMPSNGTDSSSSG